MRLRFLRAVFSWVIIWCAVVPAPLLYAVETTNQATGGEKWSAVTDDRHYHYFLQDGSFQPDAATAFSLRIKGRVKPECAAEVIEFRQSRHAGIVFDQFTYVIADLHIDCIDNLVTIMKTADYTAAGERIRAEERRAPQAISEGSVFHILKQRYCPILRAPQHESSMSAK